MANASALAEFRLAHHRSQKSLAYVIVGREIAVGIVHSNKPLHGLIHPKCGHIL